jgi:sulfofructose kinase
MSDVWVLGSAAWDLVYEIDQVPPPGGRAVARCLGRRAGGSSGNIARALGSAGHRVQLVTQVGADDIGADLLDELASWGVVTDHVLRHGSCTPETLIFIDDNAERTIIVLDKDAAETVPVPYESLAGADTVYIGHYADFEPRLPTFLRQTSSLVVAAPPPESARDWFAHIIVGSQAEYPTSWLAAPYEELRQRAGTQLQWVIVTRGGLGATAYGRTAVVTIPPIDAVARDSTGAGDSFTAGLLHALLQGHNLISAGRLGAHWAAVALELRQSAPPRWEQLGLGGSADWAPLLDRPTED